MTGCAVKAAAEALKDRLQGEAPPVSAEGWFRADHMTYPYGIHAAVVRVDPGTCAVAVERFMVAFDIGRAVNPMLVEGQIAGGAVQGIGGALLEEFVYDEAGQPLATTFADYLLPTCAELVAIETLITEDAPSPLNPLGVKGAGEGGINAAGAAIAAAVDDALGRPGTVTRLPITPRRLHRAITLSAHPEEEAS
jgi:carbon-monoxide dehydrogenase large subunit